MSENIPKTCILCVHLRFDAGDEGYSEETPGSMWWFACMNNHMSLQGYDYPSEATYRRMLLTANTCPDFEMAYFNGVTE